MLRKDKDLEWTPAVQDAVQQLKIAITTIPVLQIADPNKKFVVKTDASGIAIGAVLEQED